MKVGAEMLRDALGPSQTEKASTELAIKIEKGPGRSLEIHPPVAMGVWIRAVRDVLD